MALPEASTSASIVDSDGRYGTTEYVANLIRQTDGGDITYCEAHHNMACFYAQTAHPNLSVDVL